MAAMAARGYVAVTVDYNDIASFLDGPGDYTEGCDGDGGFDAKSKAIFDETVVGSVLYQLCDDPNNTFDHGDGECVFASLRWDTCPGLQA